MNRRALLAGIAATTIAAIGRVRAIGQPAARPTKDAVMDAERAFADAMARRDLAAFSSHLAAEAVFFSSPDGLRVLRGKPAIVDGWKRFFDGPNAPFSWAPETAEVLDSGSLAMTTGPVKDENGRVTGRFSSVWRLESDGRWRVVFDRGCACG
jgi:ketosteroid isomerase-like protein